MFKREYTQILGALGAGALIGGSIWLWLTSNKDRRSITPPSGVEEWKQLLQDLYVCSKLPQETVLNLKSMGFRTVIVLSLESDFKFSHKDEETIRSLGLVYIHCPIKPGKTLDDTQVVDALKTLDHQLEGKTLIECSSGARALAVGIIHVALRKRLSTQEVDALFVSSGLSKKPLKDWAKDFIARHSLNQSSIESESPRRLDSMSVEAHADQVYARLLNLEHRVSDREVKQGLTPSNSPVSR